VLVLFSSTNIKYIFFVRGSKWETVKHFTLTIVPSIEGEISMNISGLILLLSILVYLIAVVLVFRTTLRSRTKARTPADRQFIGEVYRDDDQYWYGVLFYNNPDDPAMFVPRRFGFGWTLNFGNPRARLFLIATLSLPPLLLILNILLCGNAPIGCHPSGCHPLP